MPPHGGEIPYEKRVAVICLRLLFGFTYATIGEKLDLKIRSVHQVYSRAMQRTEEHLRNSFVDVAKNVRDAPRSGRPATGRSKRKPRASRAKGQARPAESGETRPEVLGSSAEEQRPLVVPGAVDANVPTGGVIGTDAGSNRESRAEPAVSSAPSLLLPQPQPQPQHQPQPQVQGQGQGQGQGLRLIWPA